MLFFPSSLTSADGRDLFVFFCGTTKGEKKQQQKKRSRSTCAYLHPAVIEREINTKLRAVCPFCPNNTERIAPPPGLSSSSPIMQQLPLRPFLHVPCNTLWCAPLFFLFILAFSHQLLIISNWKLENKIFIFASATESHDEDCKTKVSGFAEWVVKLTNYRVLFFKSKSRHVQELHSRRYKHILVEEEEINWLTVCGPKAAHHSSDCFQHVYFVIDVLLPTHVRSMIWYVVRHDGLGGNFLFVCLFWLGCVRCAPTQQHLVGCWALWSGWLGGMGGHHVGGLLEWPLRDVSHEVKLTKRWTAQLNSPQERSNMCLFLHYHYELPSWLLLLLLLCCGCCLSSCCRYCSSSSHSCCSVAGGKKVVDRGFCGCCYSCKTLNMHYAYCNINLKWWLISSRVLRWSGWWKGWGSVDILMAIYDWFGMTGDGWGGGVPTVAI